MIHVVLAASPESTANIAILALIFSGVSGLVSLSALRFSKVTKIAEMRKELVTRYVAIRDAVHLMRVKTVARENPRMEPSLAEAFEREDSVGFKKAFDEAVEKLEAAKKASDKEVIRLYSQELPSLDSFARGSGEIAEMYDNRKKKKKA